MQLKAITKRGLILIVIALLLASQLPLRAQQWQALPMVTSSAKKLGFVGGEGAQAIRTLVISQADPRFLMMGTDVGGLYRSLDGGNRWQVCMVGWNARGANAFAIDPVNPNRVIGVGGNGNDVMDCHGVYLSTDKAASWKHTLKRKEGNEWRSASVAIDRSSYDKSRGYCSTAYFDSRDGGLFKSLDGGSTWACIQPGMGGMVVKVHPTRGFVYLASNNQQDHGFFKSTDGGKSFRKVNDNYTLGLDVIPTRPENVYISRWDKVLLSKDAGETFQPVGKNEGLPNNTPIQDIRVSPADPNHMACRHGGKEWWEAFVFTSVDGGDHWQKPTYDNTMAFLPFTQPDMRCAWHPTNPNLVFSTAAGGWIVRSTDAGLHYSWASDGENAVMVGGSFQFSPTSPNSVFLSFQDYNGATTSDGGQTWVYCNPSGQGWGGFEYGGYAVDNKIMWCGDAPSWGGPRTLKVSQDGGKTWTIMKDASSKPIVFNGPDVSYSDPLDASICFASNWRSTDKGKTWTAMPECDGVFTSSPAGARQLYGKHGNNIVMSSDHGVTWKVVASVSGGIQDLAIDHVHNRIWIASEDVLKKYEAGAITVVPTPKDQYGAVRVGSVAVDPVNPNMVYAGNHKDIYACTNAVVQSKDGGVTWQNITVNSPLASANVAGGPHEVQWLRVHPTTHRLWVSGQCYGMWKW